MSAHRSPLLAGLLGSVGRGLQFVNPRVSELPSWSKLAVDAMILSAATPLAFWVLHDFSFAGVSAPSLAAATIALVLLKAAGYLSLELHRQSWTKVIFSDLTRLALYLAAVAAVGTVLGVMFSAGTVPSALPLLDGLLTLALMGGGRAIARGAAEQGRSQAVPPDKRRRVLVIGAGEAGTMIVRELLRHPETGKKPVAFLDDDPRKQGQRFGGVPVTGTVAQAGEVIAEKRIDEVLIAIPSENGATIRKIMARLTEAKPDIVCKIIPGMYELISGKVAIKRIRDVEIEDLLGRPPVRLDNEAIADLITGKRVMITGAGGSIGSELVRQICRFGPAHLILVGRGENSLFGLQKELEQTWPDVPYTMAVCGIQNASRLRNVFRRNQPQEVFHAAAHKHVPPMEENPDEAMRNNVIGRRNIVELSLEHQVSHFVNVSTDKAVNPTSVMGATKRMVEYLVQEAARKSGPEQNFVSVRFGNVLGSRGSVIPVFKEQIRAGGPITVTHPDMVRYFMTIPEAAQLVLQAAGQGRNGEIYILNMGEPVKIVDLARDLIRLSGFEPDVDIPIVFRGKRPGEKLYEELMTSEEMSTATSHEKIYVAKAEPFPRERLNQVVDHLEELALEGDANGIREQLREFVAGCNIAPVQEPAQSPVTTEPEQAPTQEQQREEKRSSERRAGALEAYAN